MSKKPSTATGVLVPVHQKQKPRADFETDVEWAAQWAVPKSTDLREVHVRQAVDDVRGRLDKVRAVSTLQRQGAISGPDGTVDIPVVTPESGFYFREFNLLRVRCARIYLLLDRLRAFPTLAQARAELGAQVEYIERQLIFLWIAQSGSDAPPEEQPLLGAVQAAARVEMLGRVLARLLADVRDTDTGVMQTAEMQRQDALLRPRGLTFDHVRALRNLRAEGSRVEGAKIDALLGCSPKTRQNLMRDLRTRKPAWVESNTRGYRITAQGAAGLKEAESALGGVAAY